MVIFFLILSLGLLFFYNFLIYLLNLLIFTFFLLTDAFKDLNFPSITALPASICFNMQHFNFSFSFPCGSGGKESTCNGGDLGSIPVLGRSLGGGKGYPLQYSGLENSMDCILHGGAKSQTQLNDFCFFHSVPSIFLYLL